MKTSKIVALIKRFEHAVRAHEMKGAAPLEDHPDIDRAYLDLRNELHLTFHKLLYEIARLKSDRDELLCK